MVVSELQKYIECYTQPKAFGGKGVNGKEAFTIANWKTSKEKGDVRCSASEVLSVYPILRQWVEHVLALQRWSTTMCAAFCALCNVLDMLQAQDTGLVTADALDAENQAHLKGFLASYGPDGTIPKFHKLMHQGRQYRRHKKLISCWVLERKHKVAKRFSQDVTNTSIDWERSVLAECTNAHLDALAAPDALRVDSHLVAKRPPSRADAALISLVFGAGHDVATSTFAKLSFGGSCAVGDVCAVTNAGGMMICRVLKLGDVNGVCVALLSAWPVVEYVTGRASGRWRTALEEPLWVDVDDIIAACCYALPSDALEATVLVPFKARMRCTY